MEKSKKIVIIGGVACGPKAASRARRLLPDAEITVIEQGELISYGSCGIPLYLAGMLPDTDSLMTTAAGLKRDIEYFSKEKDVHFLTKTRAASIDRDKKEVVVYRQEGNQEDRIPYDELVLAVGAKPVIPDVPGIDLKGVTVLHHPGQAEVIRAGIKDGVKKITIIGGGAIGLEIAISLSGRGREITLVERADQLMPGVFDPEIAALIRQELEDNGVTVLIGEGLKTLKGDSQNQVKKFTTAKGIYDTEMVILACGVRPNVDLAQDCGLEIGETGAIKVNEYLQTSDPSIYAGGDCVENVHAVTGRQVYVPLASTSNKHGRVIGSNLAGFKETFPGILGTSALQVGEYNAGKTGLTEKEAIKLGYPVITTIVSGHDTAHYHPMHGKGIIKLIAHRETGKLLGVQVAGMAEVIKRLDVYAVAIQLGADLDQISKFDLGYAPPFATPIDLSIHGANALNNLKQGLVTGVAPRELQRMLAEKEDVTLLDVRTADEAKRRPLKGGLMVNIPLSELRERFGELSPKRKIVTICPLGVRAYEAACFLQGKQYQDVTFLQGGISSLPGLTDLD
ncbi:MAG: FAD-dependent oxidoreductase [Dehalobacterium sp.]